MTFLPVVGWCRRFHRSWRLAGVQNWTMERLASSLVFSVRHYHFVLCASDFVTGTVLCSPHPPAPALRVRCDGPLRSSLSLIANKLILRLQTAGFTAEWTHSSTAACLMKLSLHQHSIYLFIFHVSVIIVSDKDAMFLGDISRSPGSICSLNMTGPKGENMGNNDNI